MVEARPSQSKALLAGLIEKALTSAYPAAPAASVILERPKDPRHGDFACNVAMQLARALRRPPREIARAIADHVAAPDLVDRLEVAGAGFLNVYLNPHWKRRVVQEVLTAGPRYGTHALGQNKKVQVEYVSANPTGPLHVGHGRGAAFGASLANVLEAAGFDVTREYYVNDAGRQMDILALSTWLRYLELVGLPVAFPANAYRGDYVRQMAQTLRERDGRRYVREITGIAQGLDEPHEDPEAHLDALIAAARRELGDDFPRIHAHALEAQLADCRAIFASSASRSTNGFRSDRSTPPERSSARSRASRQPGTSTRWTARSGFAPAPSETRRTACSGARTDSTPTSLRTSPTTRTSSSAASISRSTSGAPTITAISPA
jgi:arginyl-tRNA synthetase